MRAVRAILLGLALAGCNAQDRNQEDDKLVARFDGEGADGEIHLHRAGGGRELEVYVKGLPEGRLAVRLHEGASCRAEDGSANAQQLATIDVPADGEVEREERIEIRDEGTLTEKSIGLHDADGNLVACAPIRAGLHDDGHDRGGEEGEQGEAGERAPAPGERS